MKLSCLLLLFLILSNSVFSREIGETEIITEEGIEVFQKEKYYLLKKNVKITSDNFLLSGDNIKIFFNNDMYDIKRIEALGNVNFSSQNYNIDASGENLIFHVDSEEIFINGINSILSTEDANMNSDGIIKVNNSNGNFFLEGPNSKLVNDDIQIEGEKINGTFAIIENDKEIKFLNVLDSEIAFIETNTTQLYAKNISYDKLKSTIELKQNVKIIRDGEKITGDYGTLNTETNSYKVDSNNSNKVKVIISNKNE